MRTFFAFFAFIQIRQVVFAPQLVVQIRLGLYFRVICCPTQQRQLIPHLNPVSGLSVTCSRNQDYYFFPSLSLDGAPVLCRVSSYPRFCMHSFILLGWAVSRKSINISPGLKEYQGFVILQYRCVLSKHATKG